MKLTRRGLLAQLIGVPAVLVAGVGLVRFLP